MIRKTLSAVGFRCV